jgi:hypothetical protein
MFGLDWTEILAIAVVALVLFACFWGTLSRRELLGRTITGRPHHRSPEAEHPIGRSSRHEPVPVAGNYYPSAHSEDTMLTLETSRWLRNMIQYLLQQNKFQTATADFLRKQWGDDAVVEHIYRVHVTQQRQMYASEEESLIAACESVASQPGTYAPRH